MSFVGTVPHSASERAAFGPLRVPAFDRSALLRRGVGIALLAALYWGSAELGYALKFSGSVAAIVWLPVGVAISFLYLGGLSFWPGVVIGDLLANDYSLLPFGSAIGQTTGNLLEVVLVAFVMRRFLPREHPFGSVRQLGILIGAIALGTMISATIGLLSLRLGGVVDSDSLPRLWRTWWLGDACGALLIVPLAMAWSRPSMREPVRRHLPEAVLMVVVVAGLSELGFQASARPIAYVVFPALIWAALRFGWCGATLAVLIAGGHAVWGTTHYIGPFVYDTPSHNLLATQAYIAVAALTSFFLAEVAFERQGYADRLRDSRARITETADIERRRIERDLHDGAQQRLTALAVYLEIASEEAVRRPDRAPALFGRAERELLLAIDELRELAHGIQPPVLTQAGLGKAIRRLTAASPLPIEVLELPQGRFEAPTEVAAYFVVAEALTNAQKHSHARTVLVSVAWRQGRLEVRVGDDGVGGASETAGSGLAGLRDRVEALGGDFAVDSRAGESTLVSASIPAIAVGT
jgi:signal transduction histidine kinase